MMMIHTYSAWLNREKRSQTGMQEYTYAGTRSSF